MQSNLQTAQGPIHKESPPSFHGPEEKPKGSHVFLDSPLVIRVEPPFQHATNQYACSLSRVRIHNPQAANGFTKPSGIRLLVSRANRLLATSTRGAGYMQCLSRQHDCPVGSAQVIYEKMEAL